MKQSDIMSVIMVAAIGSIMAFVIMSMVLGDPKDVSYNTVSEVSNTLTDPDPEVFSYGSVNPTVEVYVGTCNDIDRDGILDDKERETCETEGGEIPEDNPGDNPSENPPEE